MKAYDELRIVTHFIAGFPTYEASLEAARGLIAGGAYALEMQIPFSDPSADGPVIEEACRDALAGGFKTEDAFRLLETIRNESNIPIFVMSYANLVITPGVRTFVCRAVKAGASGLIIPDLTPGDDEGLFAAAAEAGCPAIPVIVPWINLRRQSKVLSEPIEWVYVALRSGITGMYTKIDDGQVAFLSRLRKAQGDKRIRIMAGFGIQRQEQLAMLMPIVDAVIVGSALVKVIAAAPDEAGKAAKDFLEGLQRP